MKDPQKQLLTAIHSRLDAAITHGGSAVPVYTVVPDTATYPYIVIGGMETTDEGVKDSYVGETFVQVDVVTGANKRGSRTHVDDISSQICERLADPSDLSMTDHTAVFLRHEMLRSLEELQDTVRLMTKGIRLRYYTEQN